MSPLGPKGFRGSEPATRPAPALPVLQVHLLNGQTSFVFEHRLSAGTRATSHHGFLHDFHHQATTSCTTHDLSLSSSTCSHLLLVTSSHLDFPYPIVQNSHARVLDKNILEKVKSFYPIVKWVDFTFLNIAIDVRSPDLYGKNQT